jgi:outer membrane immunogenic protein
VLAPTHSWSGVFFGANIGGGWGESSLTEELFIGIPNPPPSITDGASMSGVLGGVQLGAMKQFGSFVVGTELSISGARIDGSNGDCAGITSGSGGAVVATCDSTVNWLAAGLGRAGLAFDRVLVYGTLGYAIAGVNHSFQADFGPGIVQIGWSKQDVAHGLAFGGGLEFAVSRDISLGVQYLHANLESEGEGLLLGGVITNGRRDVDLDIVTARLNFRWGGDCCGPAPLK